MATRKRVGILGYGALGKYLVEKIQTDASVSEKLELAFVWNRTVEVMHNDSSLPKAVILEKIEGFEPFKPDLVVEVSHPNITKNYAALFIEAGVDFFCGSPTVFAEEHVETQLRNLVQKKKNTGIYLPVGALWGAEDIQRMSNRGTWKLLWGAEDIQRMSNRGTLFGLKITMKFHPDSLKLVGELNEKLETIIGKPGEHILYEGNVRSLCPLAPNNTNTMACAAMAGCGFDRTQACLIADDSLKAHIIEIQVEGPTRDIGTFHVNTVRINPALPGAVTGQATFVSFLNSMLSAGGKGSGFHFC